MNKLLAWRKQYCRSARDGFYWLTRLGGGTKSYSTYLRWEKADTLPEHVEKTIDRLNQQHNGGVMSGRMLQAWHRAWSSQHDLCD
jgi:predicted RecB family nuclease